MKILLLSLLKKYVFFMEEFSKRKIMYAEQKLKYLYRSERNSRYCSVCL